MRVLRRIFEGNFGAPRPRHQQLMEEVWRVSFLIVCVCVWESPLTYNIAEMEGEEEEEEDKKASPSLPTLLPPVLISSHSHSIPDSLTQTYTHTHIRYTQAYI